MGASHCFGRIGLSAPLSKMLVKDIAPVALAGLLYLGAFAGLAAYFIVSRIFKDKVQAVPLEKKDIGWLTGAIIAEGKFGKTSVVSGSLYDNCRNCSRVGYRPHQI